MATRTIDLILQMQTDQAALNKTNAGVKKVEKSLKDVEQQANRTREKMEKLAQVGNRLALVGGAITAPFILAMKKYVETAKDSEGTSARIIALQKKWEESQVRIGRVTAEIVLPTLEKALDIVNKIADFAEKNPGAIKAALGIGGSLVVIGGFLSTAASIVSTLATLQGLAAGAGIGGLAGAAGGAAGIGAALAPVLSALAPIAGIAAAVVVAAEATRQLLNWALGTDTTWKDIGETARQLFILSGMGWKYIIENLGRWFSELPARIGAWMTNVANKVVVGVGGYFARGIMNLYNGIAKFGASISAGLANMANAIRSFLGLPRKAAGGMTNGVSIAGEAGREFVMSNSTTRAAENMLGGRLTQDRLLSALAGGKRVNYYDNRRVNGELSASQMHALKNGVIEAMTGAL